MRVKKRVLVGACLALDQRKIEIAAQNGAAGRRKPVIEARRHRADAGNRRDAKRDAGDEHAEAAQAAAQFAPGKAQRVMQPHVTDALGRRREHQRGLREFRRELLGARRHARQHQMGRHIDEKRQADQQAHEPNIGGHQSLRRIIAGAEHIIDIHRDQPRMRRRRRHQKEADRQHDPGQHRPRRERAPVIAGLEDQIDEEKRQPAVEQRQRAQKQRMARVEHVVGHAGERDAGEIAAKIDEPDDLRHQNADAAFGDQQRILRPDADQSDDQRDVAEIQKVGRPVIVPIDRNEHREIGRISELEGKRHAGCGRACRHAV